MMKHEFTELIDQEISVEDYKIIEVVYMYYPTIKDKDHIAQIFKLGGMILINDMYIRAAKLQELEDQERALKHEYNKKLDEIKEKRAAAEK